MKFDFQNIYFLCPVEEPPSTELSTKYLTKGGIRSSRQGVYLNFHQAMAQVRSESQNLRHTRSSHLD